MGANIRKFEAAVPRSFSFLEGNYGFERRAAVRRDFGDFRDANVVVPYYRTSVALEVVFGLADSRVSVAIYEVEGGRKPERVSFYGNAGYGRAIVCPSSGSWDWLREAPGWTVPPLSSK